MDEFLPPAPGGGYSGAPLMSRRFRAFLPVVIDVETGGFNCATDALLEIAAVLIEFGPDGRLHRGESHSYHVRPFEGSNIEPASLAVNGIDPWHPLRPAIPEKDALGRIFTEVRNAMKSQECRRAVLVGHNAAFDLGLPQRRGGARRDQAQSLPPVLVLRHRDAGRRGIRSDRARQGRAGLRHRLGFERGAFGAVRRRTHRGPVLRSLQRARWRVAQAEQRALTMWDSEPAAPEEG